MLTEIFKSVLLMSAVGGVLSTFLLCVKPITRKLFSPKWQYYIWLTVLIVMVLPVSFSLPKNTPDIPDIMTEQVQNVQTDIETPLDNQNTIIEMPKQSEKFSIPKIELPQNIFYYLSCIWILGAIFIFFAKIIKYCLFLRAIHENSEFDTTIENIPKRLKVQRTDMLDAPLIVGLIKPVLYLPDTELSEDNLNYILMHELTHYKRHDLLYKWAVLTVKSIHWFNPFVYLVSKQIDLDCEVSCDAEVAGKLSKPEQDSYMNMILGLLTNSGSNLRPLTTQMASNKKTLKRRFEMIRNMKKTSKFMSALSAVIAVVMLGTTVFASGVLSDLAAAEEEYNGTIIVNGAEQKIDIQHIDNIRYLNTDSYYIPLRHAFEILGAAVRYGAPRDNVPTVYTAEASKGIFPTYRWDGLEELAVNDSLNYIYGATTGTNQNPIIKIYFDNDTQWFCQPGCEMYSKLNADTLFSWAPPVIIKNNTAYMPIRALAYIVGGDDNVKWNDDAHDTYYEGVLNFDEESLTIDIDTNIDNTNLRVGKIIVDENNTVVYYGENLKNPESTITSFFEAFSEGNFTLMKNYCTQNCINNFFSDNYVFGMKKAMLQSISKDSDDLQKRGFVVGEWAALVNVTMMPDANSVYEPNQTATSFYLILKQQNGRYLIDEFATGL